MENEMKTALKVIRQAGITARMNVRSCCRGCADLGLADNVPVIWHFGGQGNKIRWDEDPDEVTFNHDGMLKEKGVLTDSGRIVLEAFTNAGLKIDWDQSDSMCMTIQKGETNGNE
jgi:hypothetical protein